MARTRSKFFERQAGQAVAVDCLALSPQAALRQLFMALPATTQATTTYGNIKPVGINCQAVSGYVVFRTAPAVAGGTCTITLTYTAADGVTATVITATQDILSKSNLVPFALTMTATPLMLATGSLTLSIITSNNSVGTAQVGGELVLNVYPTEDTVISDSRSGVA